METNEAENKGRRMLRFHTIELCMLGLAMVLLLALIAVTVYISKSYRGAQNAMDEYILAEQNNRMLREASDYLTEQARGFAATDDLAYAQKYYEEVNSAKRREAAVEGIKSAHPNTPACSFMQTAYRYSNDLVRQEVYAMRLMAEASGQPEENWPEDLRSVQLRAADKLLSSEEKVKAANEIVYGEPYHTLKSQILENLDFSLNNLRGTLDAKITQNGSRLSRVISSESVLIFLLFLETVSAVLLIGFLIVRPLKVYIACLRKEKLMTVRGAYEFDRLTLAYDGIEEMNAYSEMMNQEADHDPLTGLLNRAAFDHMKKLLSDKSVPVALVLLNINALRGINEKYGYEAGDRVLVRVARLLSERFRVSDYIARVGGDEFALILPGLSAQQKEIVIGKMDKVNEALLTPEDGLPPACVSAGAAFSDAGFSEDLYQKAGLALYEVRESGRKGCGVYTPESTQ